MKDDNIFSVFEKICAEDKLKEKTKKYLYEEIRKRKQREKTKQKLIAACCAFAVFFLCIVSFSIIYILPSAYIDVDINPSIELTLNCFGKVIDSDAYNEDGTKLLNEISVKNKNYYDAIKTLIDAIELAGYFEQDKLLSVTVQAKESNQESNILDGVKKSIDTCNGEHHHNAIVDIKIVTEEIKKESKQEQLSPAKYMIIQDLLKADENTNMDECRNHSIEELQQSLEEHCNEHSSHIEKEDDSEHKNHDCSHHGHSG